MRNAPHAIVFLLATLVALGICMPNALAQEKAGAPAHDGVTVFRPASFADAAPANAYDMVTRLPGFAIIEADPDVRGYAGAQGNVLVDGAWPVSKRDNTDDLLKRIPATSVQRIELIRSGANGIDMGGYAILANVVLRHDTTTETTYVIGAMASTDGWLSPLGQFHLARHHDGRTLNLSAQFQPEVDDDSGQGHIDTLYPDGTREHGRLDTRRIKDDSQASVDWHQPLAGGRLDLTATARGKRDRADTRIDALSDEAGNEATREIENTRGVELDSRYALAFGHHSKLTLMASQQLARLDDNERSHEDGEDSTFDQHTRSGESIGRMELSHAWSDALSFNASLEGAFNFLHSNARLQQQGVQVTLPGSDVRIEEKRVEAAAGMTWKPAAAWTLDAGMGLGNSTISQTGDSPLQRHFTYPKPRVALRWDVDPRNQLRMSLARVVGQLDFDDFAASASLDTGTVSAGNAELQPSQTWHLVTAWEHDFSANAAVTLSWTHDRIDDVVDRVLVITPNDIFDAPGNIGSGRRDSLTLDLALPLDPVGFSGARLSSSMVWRRSRVTDPVTGRSRPISGEKPLEGDIELTQNLPGIRVNWGITLSHFDDRKTKYKFNKIERETKRPSWTVFIERRIGAHWRLRAEATDLFGRNYSDIHEKYAGPRSSAPLKETERRELGTTGSVSISIRRSL
jgi:hypothetical protein